MCRDLYEVHEGEGCVLLAEVERLRAVLRTIRVAADDAGDRVICGLADDALNAADDEDEPSVIWPDGDYREV